MGRWKKNKGGNKGKGRKNPTEGEDNVKGVRKNYVGVEKVNENFEKYYKLQNICPEGEWDEMMEATRRSLPTTFRITASRSESKALFYILEKNLIRDAMLAENKEGLVDIKPTCLPWYPDNLAWQLNLTRSDIRRSEAYFRLHNFLISETDSGNISRQEAVSMIPPLALQVEPHHRVLDMCASPGSKTAQIIEMLHINGEEPQGFVVANDVDNKRCYMLVHQGKRLQSPSFIVSNADASIYPDVVQTDKDGKLRKFKFDRILCDVPCSGDGTIRKNVDVWGKWSPSNGLFLHMTQFSILKRGMELLQVGGLLVYSTCSLNPTEDEAVVSRMLREAQGSVRLLDINLPNLKYSKGLSTWKVCSKDLEVFDKVEDVSERWARTIRDYVFPPSAEEAQTFNLDKCMRVLPHQQDTGGFFIALLSKTKNLPWEKEDVEIAADTEEKVTASAENSKEVVSQPPAKKSRRMNQGFVEDPFVFMEENHKIWPDIKNFFGLDANLPSSNFLRRTVEGKVKNLYLTTKNVRDFVINNEKHLKIINIGVKTLARFDNNPDTVCSFRLSQEGLPALFPHITQRKLKVNKDDLILMLNQSEADKAPLVSSFSEETQKGIATLARGSLVLLVEFQVENDGPLCSLQLVGWKGAVSLRVYIPRNDRMHYLRLCGVDLAKYEINKYKQESSEGNTVPANGNEDKEESKPLATADEVMLEDT